MSNLTLSSYEQARKDFAEVLTLDPTNQEAKEALAEIEAMLSRKTAAVVEPIREKPAEPPHKVEQKLKIPEKETKGRGGSPIQWFMRQSSSLKIAILLGSSLLLLCLCTGLASMIVPTPEPTPTPAPTNTPRLLPTRTPRLPTPTPRPTPTRPPSGLTPYDPIPMGESVVADNKLQLTVLGVEFDAWARIHEANMFNPEPGEGMEYIIVTIEVRNLAAPTDTRIVSEFHFRVTGERRIIYSQPFVLMERKELNAEFFGGATIEGEIPFQVGQGEKNLVLIYDPGLGSTARYLSLGNSQEQSAATATPIPSRPTQPTTEIIPTPTPTVLVGSKTEVTRFQITSTGVQENAPLVFKDLVVYRRHGAPDVDIFGYDLGTREEFPLVQRPGHQFPSGLFGSYLVYTEDTGNPIDKSDARLLNYETGEDVLVAGGPGNQSGGGIYGELATYTDNIGNDGFGDLYVYHIRTGEREFIDSNVAVPRIWEHNVVWYYHLGSGYYNIKGYNLQKKGFFEISSVNNGYQQTPDINGSCVVWTDGRDGKSAIYEKDLITGRETLVYEVPTSGELGWPVISNRYIAWVYGRGVGAHDILVQNRTTREIVEVSNDGPQQPSPTVPDIWEDMVVWMSWHTGNGDIYGATLK